MNGFGYFKEYSVTIKFRILSNQDVQFLTLKDYFMLACYYHTSNSFINESTVLVNFLYKALKHCPNWEIFLEEAC